MVYVVIYNDYLEEAFGYLVGVFSTRAKAMEGIRHYCVMNELDHIPTNAVNKNYITLEEDDGFVAADFEITPIGIDEVERI